MLDIRVSCSAYTYRTRATCIGTNPGRLCEKSLTAPGKTYAFFSQEWVLQGLGCFASKKFNLSFKTDGYGRYYPLT